MTKGDIYTKYMLNRIMEEGTLDKNPRAHWSDLTPAHAYSVNHDMFTYDLTEGESPLITLRPIAIRSSIGELLWIYRDESSNVFDLEQKYGVRWWRSWVINPYHYDKDGKLVKGSNPNSDFYYDKSGHKLDIAKDGMKPIKSDTVDPITDFDGENILDYKSGNVLTKDATIGSTYGSIIRHYNLVNSAFDKLKNDQDNRRIIINMWQEEDFSSKHGLKPCAFLTMWNARHVGNVDYLDLALVQRSSDFCTAGCINQVQYLTFLYIVCKEFRFTPGRFTWFVDNIQIYDRHLDAAKELVSRSSVDCNPSIKIDDDVNFSNMMPENVHVEGYPRERIKKQNPQIHFEVAI